MELAARPTGPQLATGLALLAALAWAYLPQAPALVENWWNDPNYSHGFLIPLVAGWLVWRQKGALVRAAGPVVWGGLGMVALGLAALVVGTYGHEFFLRRASLVPVLWGLVLLFWGWGVARRTAFAAGYLLLAVPWPYVLYDSVAFPLRLLAARLAAWGIRLVGIPVFREGNVLELPGVTLDVIDACSGIRSLVSLVAAGAILAYLMLPNRWSKVLVVALVLPVAVLTNGLRVALTGVLAQLAGPQMLVGATHDAMGWLVFMVAFLILLGICWLLKHWLTPREDAS
ncbi:MAG: exosortase [Deltaproteobacteria bacterium]|nr:exosortase [Deltaproteobacteria bacterium]